jgi:uncharacterized membrane protein
MIGTKVFIRVSLTTICAILVSYYVCNTRVNDRVNMIRIIGLIRVSLTTPYIDNFRGPHAQYVVVLSMLTLHGKYTKALYIVNTLKTKAPTTLCSCTLNTDMYVVVLSILNLQSKHTKAPNFENFCARASLTNHCQQCATHSRTPRACISYEIYMFR